MDAAPGIASIGALIGNPTRAVMLAALLDGRAWTAGELARAARVTPQTASSHLGMLVDAQLLIKDAQGRHRYFRLANPEVAQTLEALTSLAIRRTSTQRFHSVRTDPLRDARTCYDHLAGRLGVALTDSMIGKKYLTDDGTNFGLTERGERFFENLGVDVDSARGHRRAFARKCLDWSERRHHLAGALGAGLNESLFRRKWLQRLPGSRAVTMTVAGRRELAAMLDVTM